MAYVALVLSSLRRVISRIDCSMTPAFASGRIATRALSERHIRWNRFLAGTNIHENEETSSDIARKSNKSLQSGREKRRKFIGMAKAVDRGQWAVTYSPGGSDGSSFVSRSGLPDLTKPFCVLGIESSCDDTGGELDFCLKNLISYRTLPTSKQLTQ